MTPIRYTRPCANAATTTEGEGTGSFGHYVQGEEFGISGGHSASHAKKLDGEDTIVSETTNTVFGLKVADLRINFVESYLKVTSKVGEIPTADYRIEFGGMKVGEQGVGSGNQGFIIAGNDVVGPEMVADFNKQANAYEKEFEMIGKYGLRIVEPEFGLSRSGRFIFELVAVDGLIGLAARQNQQVGDGFGYRMGVSRIASNYRHFGEPPPAAEVCEKCEDPRLGA